MSKTHGKSNTRLFNIWVNMRQRCTNPNWSDFHRYGGRGIAVCDEWNDFQKFYSWSKSNGYLKNLSIDRKDNDGNYTPENCKWSTNKEQSRNRSSNRIIKHNGISKTLAEWSEEKGIEPHTISKRIEALWPIDDALNLPLYSRRDTLITYKGETKSIADWSCKLDMNINTLRARLRSWNWNISKAFETEVDHRFSSKL